MENAFVYGTLRRGFHNHRLLQDSKFLGEALTVELFVLRARPGGIPFVGNDLALSQVHGELYQISLATLRRLDLLEGHRPDAPQHSWYIRELVDVTCQHQRIRAWMYFNSDVSEPIVPSGNYKTL